MTTAAQTYIISHEIVDTTYLARNFTIKELEKEINNCKMQASICSQFHEWNWRAFYLDLARACESAIDTIRSRKPKPTENQSLGYVDFNTTKQNIDIVDVIERYTRLNKSGTRYYGKCPIHNDSHDSLCVYPEQAKWWCFGCNAGGDVFDFIGKVERVGLKEAVSLVRR